ncbi:glycoprotease family-domain-containing protein [Tricladium varicosporioides]|nr:glycoprotease family-domain-containing protein [Hymenoscyphus varicosporioides]
MSLRRFRGPRQLRIPQRRQLLTLAIETSCDDTSVAVLEKHENSSATLHFHSKITSDNRSCGGVHPILAHEGHQKNIAKLVNEALQSLPGPTKTFHETVSIAGNYGKLLRRKPDFITVTRGPGMRASLETGLDTAKGLAVAWQIPFIGVNHMQAHALTPRLVAALNRAKPDDGSPSSESYNINPDPTFPFLTLLVSGGHTMLVHSKSLCDHKILANTTDIAVGDMLDKAARDILPPTILEAAPDVMYGPILENFVFPEKGLDICGYTNEIYEATDGPQNTELRYGWTINKPYARSGEKGAQSYQGSFSFSGIGSAGKRVINQNPGIDDEQRKLLALEVMRVAFEHLVSRVLLSLESPDVTNIRTLVISGGVASNQYLRHVFRTNLDKKGYRDMRVLSPPPKYCTDNAAMIAWTGIEMYEAGWRTDLSAIATRR